MKTTKKILSILLTLLLLLSTASVCAYAVENEFSVNIRIEGVESTIYNGTVTITGKETVTVADALILLDESNDDITITGADIGYITEVNGIKAGSYNPTKWDGWYYTLNGASTDFGVTDCNLNSGDSVVLYYGDYPCYIPEIDTTWLSANGTIKFVSTSTTYEYDAETDQWISNTVTVPLTDMNVTLDNTYKYVTNANGEITIDMATFASYTEIPLQVEKLSVNDAPEVLRFSPDFKITMPKRTTTLLGDINNNGDIDIKDATIAQMYVAQYEQPTAQDFITADVNIDYNVTITDATNIQMYVAKYINSFYVTE